ncbi:hypothetical protein C7S18_19795 [Ahniella affigens]|uniref:PEP-CTERM sorting domain-containing protein n=1 Tax=Ahniella affigens TaxID=2021234 RepID=A0A2P1PWQ8_9GAMM|nr:hypothetical protein [Ahniella affigens]AVP99270.1 hypothetical protein C7S18_19795 [Ahniella affigens]
MNIIAWFFGRPFGRARLGLVAVNKCVTFVARLVAVATISAAASVHAQTVLYSETFEGQHGWTLNVPSGTNGSDPNFWLVSDNEAGLSPPACGTTSNGNKTLHVTSVFNPNAGAVYDTGGLCGILFCPQTNMRAESPAFTTVGSSAVSLSFDYIANGDALTDNASVLYNIGAGWVVVTPSLKSPLCGTGHGQWARFEALLPAEAGNQPNLRIGINWTNNDDGVGTDPSVAINNVQVIDSPSILFADSFE